MKPPMESSVEDRRELHREKMRNKKARRAKAFAAGVGKRRVWRWSKPFVPASINRHTGKPHEGQREQAKQRGRFCRKGGAA